MFKIIIVILITFHIIACEPTQQASRKDNNQKKVSFICLSSQSQCEINSKFGRFTVQFSEEDPQDKVKTELPFQIQLTLNSADNTYQLKSISSYLEGKTMFMGKIPIFFEMDNGLTNVMVAESLLANCSEEVMIWRLWFKIELFSHGEVHQQDFFIDFDSQRL